MAVEFALVMFVALMVIGPTLELIRVSLFDQALARVTHQGVRRAAADLRCAQAVEEVFEADSLAGWLLADDAGDITFTYSVLADLSAWDSDDWPTVAGEVRISVRADNRYSVNGGGEVVNVCGDAGAWVRLRSRIFVEPWFRPVRELWPGFRREHESWARNSL